VYSCVRLGVKETGLLPCVFVWFYCVMTATVRFEVDLS
jgi:hypothetical protein